MSKTNKQNLIIIIATVFAGILIFLAINYANKSPSRIGDVEENNIEENVNNVSVVDGKQIIEIRAKGGYSPKHTIAKAGIPTILRMNTNGTFDCTSSVRLPSLNISQSLPMSGSTDIDLGTQKVSTLNGTCGMGMYPFDIKFE